MTNLNYAVPDSSGHFGTFGGRFVPETLIQPLIDLERAYREITKDPQFRDEFSYFLENYVGRPTPLYPAERLSREVGGVRIFLKREDLAHTGAHKINNCIGQALLAKKMGKTRLIAETGAGQHGVATATVAALFGFSCVVYMGDEDMARQAANVRRMKYLGAEVAPVSSGSKTLKDALNEAMRDWVAHVKDTHYMIGSVAGPHPYPLMVRDFQSVIGIETKRQIAEAVGRQPDILMACVGGGSNAIGMFYPFVENAYIRMIGVEAAGEGIGSGRHAATLSLGTPGVLHGAMSYVLQDSHGQILPAHSVAAGLDYPGVGPEHSYLKQIHRVEYVAVTDEEALDAFHILAKTEGILPALESAHAVAYLLRLAKTLEKETVVVLNLSGRGDKDLDVIQKYLRSSTGVSDQ